MKNGQRCITGCVATAMAQVMKYWEWPMHGYGSKTYYDEKGCGKTLSQDFSLNTYDWDNMLNEYNSSGSWTGVEATAVATLMRDCGYAVEMRYTPSESSAVINAQILQTYFHYSPVAVDRYVKNYPEEMWHEFIRKDLSEGRPVLYNGQSTTGGHEFILDGYDSEGYYHVNWGWGGRQDGWFMLTNLNGYNDDQWMINHLEPNYTNDKSFSYTLSADGVLTINGEGFMPEEYALNTAPWNSECTNIRKIIIGDGVTGIVDNFGYSDNYYTYFSNLREIVLPEGLKTIGINAFYYARQLTSVNLPSSLVNMYYAFCDCRNLTALQLPKNLEKFYDYLPRLTALTVEAENPFFSTEDNILYNKDGTGLLYIPQGLSNIIISEKTEEIYDDVDNLFRGNQVFFKGKKAPSILSNSSYFSYVSKSGRIFIPYESTGYTNWKSNLPSGWRFLTYTDLDYFLNTNINWDLLDETTEPIITAHLYNGEQQIKSLDDWEKLLTTYPNAVGMVDSESTFLTMMSRNLISTDATTETGYRCPYFRLTDLTYGYNTAAKASQTGFFTPVPFTVTKGSYSRKFTKGFNTVCLPFAVLADNLPEDCQMFAYSHFDSENSDAVFLPQSTAEAGHACFVTCQADATWQADLTGVTIAAQEASLNDGNMRGTFTTTEAYQGIGYNPRNSDNIFAPLGQYLHPFRACFLMNVLNSNVKIHIRLEDGAVVDAVKAINKPLDIATDIYSLDGKRLITPKKGQAYIKNGKIVIR